MVPAVSADQPVFRGGSVQIGGADVRDVDFAASRLYEDGPPFALWDELRELAPVKWNRAADDGFWVVTSYHHFAAPAYYFTVAVPPSRATQRSSPLSAASASARCR